MYHIINGLFINYNDVFYDHETRDGVDNSIGYESIDLMYLDIGKSVRLYLNSYNYPSEKINKMDFYGKFLMNISDNFNFYMNVFDKFSVSDLLFEKYLIIIKVDFSEIQDIICSPKNIKKSFYHKEIFEIYDTNSNFVNKLTYLNLFKFIIFQVNDNFISNKDRVLSDLNIKMGELSFNISYHDNRVK